MSNIYNVYDSTGKSLYSGNNASKYQSAFAGLQKANPPSAFGGPASVPGINNIELPSWMGKNPDSQIGELLQSYSNIGAAFDPSGQVAARNNAIGYNTSAGNQAANNAATEYSNRASQSGASGLGAGAVRAQALMPVFAQNAALKNDAADVAAKAHQEGATLASQIASTIGQLRTSYLSSLTSYAQGQQGLALEKYKAEQSAAAANAQNQLGYAQLQAQQYQQSQAMKQQNSGNALSAANSLLGIAQPGGAYTMNNQGQVTNGLDYYNQLKDWRSNRNTAQNALLGML